jgi:hypothetical protein
MSHHTTNNWEKWVFDTVAGIGMDWHDFIRLFGTIHALNLGRPAWPRGGPFPAVGSADGCPRSCIFRLFFKKALEFKRNQPAVQNLSHKILHKTPRTLSNWTHTLDRPPSPLGPAFHTKWALVGRIQPQTVLLFSVEFIIYLIRLTSCKKYKKIKQKS